MTTFEPRTAVVTIFQGDYLDRIRFLEQKYQAAVESEKSGPPRMNDEVPESVGLAEEHKALVAEAEATALNVTLKALGRKAWRALVAQHPPRDGNDEDKAVGVNEETFKDALIAASVVAPDLSEDDLDALADTDNDALYYTAFGLNRSRVVGPKVLPVSQANQQSDVT